MKRWLFSLLFVVVGVFVAMWLWQMPQRVVRSELHPLYLRYEHCPDVAAGFVKNLRIADTVTIDAVTLQAKDTATWFRLLEELQVKEATIAKVREFYIGKRNSCITFNIEKNASLRRTIGKNKDYDVVVCTISDLSVCIYDVKNDVQEHIIIEKEFEKLEQFK